MEMMWGVLVILLCGSLASGVSVNEISLICDDYSGEIPESDTYAPSLLVDLKATATLDQGHYLFNISWAIAVDSTLKYVKGIIILVTGNVMLKCEYDPPLKELKLPNDQEEPIWFHHSVYAFYAPQPFIVQAKNIPQQPVDHDIPYRYVTVYPPRRPDVADEAAVEALEDQSLKEENEVQPLKEACEASVQEAKTQAQKYLEETKKNEKLEVTLKDKDGTISNLEEKIKSLQDEVKTLKVSLRLYNNMTEVRGKKRKRKIRANRACRRSFHQGSRGVLESS